MNPRSSSHTSRTKTAGAFVAPVLIALLFAGLPLDAGSAQPRPALPNARASVTTVVARDPPIRSVASRLDQPAPPIPLLPPASGPSARWRRGVVGGLIGLVAGVAMCTLISNALFNEGGGFSTCTTKGNVIFASGGFGLGFAIGWLTAPRARGS